MLFLMLSDRKRDSPTRDLACMDSWVGANGLEEFGKNKMVMDWPGEGV